MLDKLKYNLYMGLLFAFLVILPDYLFQIFLPNIHYVTDFYFIAVISLFGFFLSMAGTDTYIVCAMLFSGMQIIQLGHIAYFLRPINPLDIGKVFGEYNDVYEAAVSDLHNLWFVPIAAFVPFLILVLMEYKWKRKMYISYFAIVAVVIFLGVKPERATRRGLQHFLPPETRYSMHNSINSFSYYLIKGMDEKNIKDEIPENFYQKYAIKKLDKSSDLVVLVMGESTSANKMHLFNPKEVETSPKLESLKDDKNFMYQKAISGAVSTHSSLPLFFNMVKEPGNVDKFDYDTNLFKMAKENGYNTYFYSVYDAKQTNLIGVPYIDKIITEEYNRHLFKNMKEDYLLELFKDIDLKNGKNFVVLNFRTVHSPYEKNYERHPEFDVFKPKDLSRFEEENSAYSNAMLYVDSVLYQMIDYFKSLKIDNSQFIFTADHAEMLGSPEGKYGHNQLYAESMLVPFIFYNMGGETPKLPKGKISHYEIAELVANYLGYEVNNPNYDNNTFFVHGNNLFEEYEFLKFHREASGAIIKDYKTTVTKFVRDNAK